MTEVNAAHQIASFEQSIDKSLTEDWSDSDSMQSTEEDYWDFSHTNREQTPSLNCSINMIHPTNRSEFWNDSITSFSLSSQKFIASCLVFKMRCYLKQPFPAISTPISLNLFIKASLKSFLFKSQIRDPTKQLDFLKVTSLRKPEPVLF